MDIIAIEEAIQSLENDLTTPENVSELASLYICRNNLQPTLQETTQSHNNLFEDQLPYYNKYVDIKKRYQLKQTTEGEVITGIKLTCKELEDFIINLYQSTDMNKERICIKKMICELYTRYCNL